MLYNLCNAKPNFERKSKMLSIFTRLEGADAPVNGGGPESIAMLIGMVLLIGAMYFFMIRPQKKQEKETAKMRDNLVVGDEITTIGGIIGKIVSIKEETCVIETGRERTTMRILKSSVARVDVHAEDAQ